jgi:hypothetical protein
VRGLAASFVATLFVVAVAGLYVVLAASVQVALDPDDPRVAASLGDRGRSLVTAIGLLRSSGHGLGRHPVAGMMA